MTGHPQLIQKDMETSKFIIEAGHDLDHDRWIGSVKDEQGNTLVSIDTLEGRVLFSSIVNVIKNEIK